MVHDRSALVEQRIGNILGRSSGQPGHDDDRCARVVRHSPLL
jgi:hypothetical protein